MIAKESKHEICDDTVDLVSLGEEGFIGCLCVLTPQVQQQLTPVPVQHVYANQVQYVEGGETNYTTSTMLE